MYFASSVGSFAREPLAGPDEQPAPAPDQYKRQSSAFDRVPPVPLPCLPAPDPPVYCDDSAGPFWLTPPVEPDVEPPAPDPVLKESHRSPPDVVPPEPEVGEGGDEVPDEPSVGLEQVRMTPLEKSTPVPNGAGASPGALHDSGPTPASIARVSRDSITMRREEERGGFLVFRRFTGLLLGRPLRSGPIPSLGIHRRKGFHFSQGIGSRWIQFCDGGESSPRRSSGKGLFSG